MGFIRSFPYCTLWRPGHLTDRGAGYTLAARADLRPFFPWTVYVRGSVILFFAAFVLLGYAPAQLILFSVVDLLGALWTWLALRAAKA